MIRWDARSWWGGFDRPTAVFPQVPDAPSVQTSEQKLLKLAVETLGSTQNLNVIGGLVYYSVRMGSQDTRLKLLQEFVEEYDLLGKPSYMRSLERRVAVIIRARMFLLSTLSDKEIQKWLKSNQRYIDIIGSDAHRYRVHTDGHYEGNIYRVSDFITGKRIGMWCGYPMASHGIYEDYFAGQVMALRYDAKNFLGHIIRRW